MADNTQREAVEVQRASDDAWPTPPAVDRFLSAVDQSVPERFTPQTVRARLAELERAAATMPKPDDPQWTEVVEALARYGHQVVRSWVLVLQSADEQTTESLHPARRPLTGHDADLLASETVARAINSFGDEVTRVHWWTRDHPVDPRSIFLAECALQFPNAYRSRLLETGRLSSDAQEWWWSAEEADFPLELLRTLEYRVRNEKNRVADVLRPTGYTGPEIAEIIAATQEIFDRAMRLSAADEGPDAAPGVGL